MSQVRLDDLVTVPVAIAWHEAVAVVRVVARLVLLDPHAQPDVAHTWLRDDGTLWLERSDARRAHAPARRTGTPSVQELTWPPPEDELDDVALIEVRRGGLVTCRDTPGELVAALSALLGALLPPSAPDRLQALADPTRVDVYTALPETFIAALSVFARPDDDRELRALARRASLARESVERTATLRELTARARVPPPPPPPPPVEPARRVRAHLVIVGAGVLASALAGVAWWVVAGGESVDPPVGSAAKVEYAGGAPGSARIASADPSRPAVRPSRRRPAPARSEQPSGGSPRPALPPTLLGATVRNRLPPDDDGLVEGLAGSADRSAGLTGGALHEAGEAPSSETDAPRHTDPTPAKVYRASDTEVTVPTILRAQMPERPIGGLPSRPRGTLELLVDEHGAVQRARLLSNPSGVQDRLMISAAKTWRFAAATRHGTPVPYLLHVPVTW